MEMMVFVLSYILETVSRVCYPVQNNTDIVVKWFEAKKQPTKNAPSVIIKSSQKGNLVCNIYNEKKEKIGENSQNFYVPDLFISVTYLPLVKKLNATCLSPEKVDLFWYLDNDELTYKQHQHSIELNADCALNGRKLSCLATWKNKDNLLLINQKTFPLSIEGCDKAPLYILQNVETTTKVWPPYLFAIILLVVVLVLLLLYVFYPKPKESFTHDINRIPSTNISSMSFKSVKICNDETPTGWMTTFKKLVTFPLFKANMETNIENGIDLPTNVVFSPVLATRTTTLIQNDITMGRLITSDPTAMVLLKKKDEK